MLKRIRYHVLAVLVGASFGCRDEGDAASGVVSTAEIKSACESYCARGKACDEETDLVMCLSDCRERMADCLGLMRVQLTDAAGLVRPLQPDVDVGRKWSVLGGERGKPTDRRHVPIRGIGAFERVRGT